MAGRIFSFATRFSGSTSLRLPFILSAVVCGSLFAISTIPTGTFHEKVSHLVQFACLAGIAYVAVVLKQYIATEDKARSLPKTLACDSQFFEHFRLFAESLNAASHIPDPVFRNAALHQLAAIGQSLKNLGDGMLTFENTESWRLIYEQILRSKVVYSYKSVAWVRDLNYWQDEPGQKSIRLNQELVSRQQLSMERIFILQDALWPNGTECGDSKVTELLKENVRSKIKVFVIRESSLNNDQDLLVDFGIYGSHAVGYQVIDGRHRTHRFTIQFNFDAVALAEQRWQRLLAYAIPFEENLERPP
jgi:hypothetical protein